MKNVQNKTEWCVFKVEKTVKRKKRREREFAERSK